MPKKLMVLNGPNLNLLGTREPEKYGHTTLADVEASIGQKVIGHGLDVDCRQSNTEGTLVDWIQEAGKDYDGIIINAGAYTHTSVAIRDAVAAIAIPVVEVHISNVYAREEFRHHSYISAVASGVIVGLGTQGYLLAVDALASMLRAN